MGNGATELAGSRWDHLDRWIFTSYELRLEQLGLFRIAFAAYVLLVLGAPNFMWIAEMPQAFFHPPLSVARLFSGFPPPLVLQLFSVGLVGLYLALLVGFKTRFVSVSITVVQITAYSFDYSLGKINHTETLISLLPLVMSFSNWGAAYSVDSRGGRPTPVRTWPVTFMALLLGFAMFTAGLPKLTSGWLALDSLAVREKLFYEHFVNGKDRFLVGAFVGVENRAFWELLDWSTVAFEIGFLLAVARASLTRLFTGVAVFFHTATLLMLNIAFLPHLIVYLLFSMPLVAVPGWLERIPRLDGRLLTGGAVAYSMLYVLDLPTTVTEVGWAGLERVFGVPGDTVFLIVLLAACGITLALMSTRIADLMRSSDNGDEHGHP